MCSATWSLRWHQHLRFETLRGVWVVTEIKTEPSLALLGEFLLGFAVLFTLTFMLKFGVFDLPCSAPFLTRWGG